MELTVGLLGKWLAQRQAAHREEMAGGVTFSFVLATELVSKRRATKFSRLEEFFQAEKQEGRRSSLIFKLCDK